MATLFHADRDPHRGGHHHFAGDKIDPEQVLNRVHALTAPIPPPQSFASLCPDLRPQSLHILQSLWYVLPTS
jgi:hypothetical protein